jgi:type IV pilus assembly protein PilA
MKKNANKGISLVELIIVIAIMAVLIGVLAPQFIKQVEKSRESTDLQNIEEYKTAVETYVSESEGITADIVITVDGANKKLYYTVADLSSYGLPAAGETNAKALKSAKWSQAGKGGAAGTITITYSKDNYTWSYNPAAGTAGATYFHIDGTPES